MRCFCLYIYKAILLAKNSGHSGYFAKIDVLHTLHDSGYFCKNYTACITQKYELYIIRCCPAP